uniref:Uncharacterized protein n=1 Tax=viral metagenome TaxID=1070528 RepID=A0A6C0K9I9_9ZZZZ
MLSKAAELFVAKFTQSGRRGKNGKYKRDGFAQELPPIPTGKDMAMASALMFLFQLAVIAILGKYLWNTNARKLMPFLGKCDSALTIVGLQVLISILIPGMR